MDDGAAGARLALARITQRLLRRQLRDRHTLQADRKPRAVHHREHAEHALVLFADEVADRAALVAVNHGAGGRAMDAELVLDRMRAHVVALTQCSVFIEHDLRHQKQRDAFGAGRRIGQPRQHEMDDVGGQVVLAIGDEDFRAGDAIASVGCARRARAQGADIGARLRLSELHGAHPLAADKHAEITLLEIVAAVGGERIDGRHGQRRADAERHGARIPHLDAGGVHRMRQVLAAEFGGQDLPHAVNAACIEMWNSGSMAFGIGPALTMAAIDALAAYGSDNLKQRYLGRLISGEWMDTMQLTEPQAGSDVGALRTRATRAPDGSYRITGSKIFITYGEHDLTDNIIHFVLARLPDAPPGTKGVSLFLVPKVMLNEDGTLGKHNDVRAHSVEHKLGIHGSPTCTMIYGDQGGAIGFLIGEEHKGMLCMFTMMNRTRLAVGLQGVAIAELATQQALSYARERKQGAGGAIIHYPDVKRMLLTMRAAPV